MAKVTTQDAVDRAADALLKEYNYDIEKVIANQVAKAIGWAKGNDLIKAALENWKERRISEGVPFIAKAPPELDEALDVTCESLRRLLRGLTGKYRAEDGEIHEREIDKWSDRYDSLEVERDELQHKLDDAEERCRTVTDERDQLASELAATRGELSQEKAKLQAVQDQYDKLLKTLGGLSGLAADEQPVPCDDVAPETGLANPSERHSPQKRGPGRPRKGSG
ncbi:hypothetical protein C0V72_14855 [Porphyrobacter sp. TH134]|uniref:hypothetical protein n=1 Tax=Porphyrobacter sp. TH134 TaxID=2067450 RepID=UPI000C7C1CEB|nr:hypothetical protein [Porphyrobacter sp. TH134]PLK22435.1 hypothetical protein C0V72_14855 [Porphyrobacter sp. TH134]